MIIYVTEPSLPYLNQNTYDHPNMLEVDVRKLIICIMSNNAVKLAYLAYPQFSCKHE